MSQVLPLSTSDLWMHKQDSCTSSSQHALYIFTGVWARVCCLSPCPASYWRPLSCITSHNISIYICIPPSAPQHRQYQRDALARQDRSNLVSKYLCAETAASVRVQLGFLELPAIMMLFRLSKWICSGFQGENLPLLTCDEWGTLNLACKMKYSCYYTQTNICTSKGPCAKHAENHDALDTLVVLTKILD